MDGMNSVPRLLHSFAFRYTYCKIFRIFSFLSRLQTLCNAPISIEQTLSAENRSPISPLLLSDGIELKRG